MYAPCAYVCVQMCLSTNGEIKGQLAGISPLLLPCGFWGVKLRSSGLVASVLTCWLTLSVSSTVFLCYFLGICWVSWPIHFWGCSYLHLSEWPKSVYQQQSPELLDANATLLAFYTGPGDSDSCSYICTVNTFTHWAIFLAPSLIYICICIYLYEWMASLVPLALERSLSTSRKSLMVNWMLKTWCGILHIP